MNDIIDEIDALVDAQLEQEASGYDHNINQDRCPHCGDDWHGLAVTERVRRMRSAYCGCERCERELADYRSADDDTPLWCPGSNFIGPWANKWQLTEIRNRNTVGGYVTVIGPLGWALPDDPLDPSEWFTPGVERYGQIEDYSSDPAMRVRRREIPDGPPMSVGRDLRFGYRLPERPSNAWSLRDLQELRQQWYTARTPSWRIQVGGPLPESEMRFTARRWLPGDPVPGEPETDELDSRRARLRRAIRRPDTTPPMWANDPASTRRARTNSRRRHR